MSDISKLINELSNFKQSLDSSQTNTAKENIINLRNQFPNMVIGMNDFFREELQEKGLLNEDLIALLTPGKPTNLPITPIEPVAFYNPNEINKNKAVIFDHSDDKTEKTSLKEFKNQYKKNKSVPNLFISRNIEEDDKFVKCKCPRCNMSSFLIKQK